jgi:hypothetical protein
MFGVETLVVPFILRGMSSVAMVAVDLVIEPDGNSNPRHHPSRLIPFFLTSRTIYDAVSFDNNPQLYNTLFRKTFDTAALGS